MIADDELRRILAGGGSLVGRRDNYPFPMKYKLMESPVKEVATYSEKQIAELVRRKVVTFAPQTPGNFDVLVATLLPKKVKA